MIPSRIERTSPNGRFAVAFGVDHVTGPYCQVWLAPMDEQEGALIVVDNQGVRPPPEHEEPVHAALAEMLDPEAGVGVLRWLRQTRRRFEVSAKVGNPYPNIDHHTVTRLFVLFGFPKSVIGREVWEAFD